MCRRKYWANFPVQEFIILISLFCIQVAVSVATNMFNANQGTITEVLGWLHLLIMKMRIYYCITNIIRRKYDPDTYGIMAPKAHVSQIYNKWRLINPYISTHFCCNTNSIHVVIFEVHVVLTL